MISNFNIYELKYYIRKLDGVTVSNCTNKPENAVFIHKERNLIAQIRRTSANYYEIITASPIYCQRYCEKSFNSAIKKVINFFNDDFWNIYYNHNR